MSIDRDPRTQNGGPKVLQKMKRSSSSGSVAGKLPNSLPGSLSEAEAAAFQRPTGSSENTSMIGRTSGSSLSSSIFREPNQWVIDYNDLVSSRCSQYHVPFACISARVCVLHMHPWQLLCLCQ